MYATLAFRELLSGADRRRVCERAGLALDEVRRSATASSHLANRQAPGMCLVWTDELDSALELWTELLEAAAASGRRRSFELFSVLRGYTAQRRGDLANAAADIEPVLSAAQTAASPGFVELVALITHLQLLIDDGRADLAEERACAVRIPAGFERGFMAAHLRHCHGAALLAQGRFDAAATVLAEAGALCEANGIRTPALFPWRSDLARALSGTDRHEEAIGLAAAEMRLADECDLDRARGHALRALGLLSDGDAGLRHLEAAAEAFRARPRACSTAGRATTTAPRCGAPAGGATHGARSTRRWTAASEAARSCSPSARRRSSPRWSAPAQRHADRRRR